MYDGLTSASASECLAMAVKARTDVGLPLPTRLVRQNLAFYVNMCFSDERGVMRGDVSCFLVSAAFAQRRAPLQGATSSHSARGSQQAKAGESPARAALSFLR